MIDAVCIDSKRFAAIYVAALVMLTLSGCGQEFEPAAIDPSSHRNLPAGPIVGFTGSYGSHVWLGIDYALPPVGEGRWRKPVPAPSWTSHRRN